MTQIHIPSTSTSADLERLDSPYTSLRVFYVVAEKREKDNFTYMYSQKGSFAETEKSGYETKLNHHNGLTRCLQMAGKLLSTFEFRFRARDRQRKCDSVLPRKEEGRKNREFSLKITSFL